MHEYCDALTVELDEVAIRTNAFEARPAAATKEAAQQLEAFGYPVVEVRETTARGRLVPAPSLLSTTPTMNVATGSPTCTGRHRKPLTST
jgi:hypothetical protein